MFFWIVLAVASLTLLGQDKMKPCIKINACVNCSLSRINIYFAYVTFNNLSLIILTNLVLLIHLYLSERWTACSGHPEEGFGGTCSSVDEVHCCYTGL